MNEKLLNVEEYLRESIAIEPTQLATEFCHVASQLSYWNEQYAESLRAQLHSKIARERLHANLLFEKRNNMGGKPTEAMVDAAIETDPRYQRIRDAEADAQAECARMKGIAEAVRTKREMLVSLGAHMRAELRGDPSLRQDPEPILAD